MKKNVLWMTILMAVMSLSAMAQNIKADSLTKIPLGSRVDFTMDFSKATIHDRSESDFAKYEPDWEKDKPSIVDRFRSAANLVLDKDLKFGDYPEADYQIVITVKSMISGFQVLHLEGPKIFPKKKNCRHTTITQIESKWKEDSVSQSAVTEWD